MPRPSTSTLTDTLFPYTTLVRSNLQGSLQQRVGRIQGRRRPPRRRSTRGNRAQGRLVRGEGEVRKRRGRPLAREVAGTDMPLQERLQPRASPWVLAARRARG